MSNVGIWYKDNDMVIEVANVTDAITSLPIDDATILATLQDGLGVDVPGIVWPQTVPNVSSGFYQLIIDKAAAIVPGDQLQLLIVLTTPAGGDAYWEIPLGAEVRTL